MRNNILIALAFLLLLQFSYAACPESTCLALGYSTARCSGATTCNSGEVDVASCTTGPYGERYPCCCSSPMKIWIKDPNDFTVVNGALMSSCTLASSTQSCFYSYYTCDVRGTYTGQTCKDYSSGLDYVAGTTCSAWTNLWYCNIECKKDKDCPEGECCLVDNTCGLCPPPPPCETDNDCSPEITGDYCCADGKCRSSCAGYPNVTITPAIQYGLAGEALSYTVTVNNSNNSAPVSFTLTYGCPQNWTCSFSKNTIVVNQSNITTMSVLPPLGKDAGSYRFSATAARSSNTSISGIGYATYVLESQCNLDCNARNYIAGSCRSVCESPDWIGIGASDCLSSCCCINATMPANASEWSVTVSLNLTAKRPNEVNWSYFGNLDFSTGMATATGRLFEYSNYLSPSKTSGYVNLLQNPCEPGDFVIPSVNTRVIWTKPTFSREYECTKDQCMLRLKVDNTLIESAWSTNHWVGVINTSIYHSDVTANVTFLPTGATGEDSESYEVVDEKYILIAVSYPYVKNRVVPLTETGEPNFTRTMPIEFSVKGIIRDKNSPLYSMNCDDSICNASYNIDGGGWKRLSWNALEKAFTDSASSNGLTCNVYHSLNVMMASAQASGTGRIRFYINCIPKITVNPKEVSIALGRKNIPVFNVTIWNPVDTSHVYDLEMKNSDPTQDYLTHWTRFEYDNDKIVQHPLALTDLNRAKAFMGSMDSASTIVQLTEDASSVAGVYPIKFTATGSYLEGEGTLMVYAEGLNEFAVWQLFFLMMFATLVMVIIKK
ncbi:MAG: hypothetical protein V1900_02680 [Candidatus Aenigmatarchaeota archaeon]